MRPINIIVLVITFIEALRAFDIVYVINGAQRSRAHRCAGHPEHRRRGQVIGFGSALAIMMLVISSVFVVFYLSVVPEGGQA